MCLSSEQPATLLYLHRSKRPTPDYTQNIATRTIRFAAKQPLSCHCQLLRVCRGRCRDGEKSRPLPRPSSELSGAHQRHDLQMHRNTDWPQPRPSRDTSKHPEGNCAGTRYIDRTILHERVRILWSDADGPCAENPELLRAGRQWP